MSRDPYDVAWYDEHLRPDHRRRRPASDRVPIEIVEYDPEWPRLYAREEERIRSVLGDRVVRIEHAGSTSVPGLPGEAAHRHRARGPRFRATSRRTCPDLEAAGYRVVIREPEWFEHRVFKGPDTNVNLHTFTAGCEEVDAMLLFRDHLRGAPRTASSTRARSASSPRIRGSTCSSTPTRRPPSCRRSRSAHVFSVEERDALRERVLRLAEEDERVVAGAAVGSLALGGGDRWSDLDLTFAVADDVPVATVLDDWTRALADEVEADPPRRRRGRADDVPRAAPAEHAPVRPLDDAGVAVPCPQAHASSCSSARRRAGYAARTSPVAGDLFGWGVIYALHARVRASSAVASGRRSTTSVRCATTRSRSPACARA